MGKISKHSNLYDKDGMLLRHVDENGLLRDYTLEELENYCNSLTPGSQEYRNCCGVLMDWYQNPRTKEDKEYVQKKQQELLEKLQKQAEENKKKSPATVVEALQEVDKDLDNQIQDAEFEEIKDEDNGTDRK